MPLLVHVVIERSLFQTEVNLYLADFSHLEPLCGVAHMALTTLRRRRFSPLKKRTAWSFDGKTNARPGPSSVRLVYCVVSFTLCYTAILMCLMTHCAF